MKKKLNLILLTISVLLPISCIDNLFCIEGDGIIKTERRSVAAFNQVENSTEFDVVFTKADTTGISITADRNIIDNIETIISGSVLEIQTRPNVSCFRYNQRPVIHISSPGISGVRLSGSGNFNADYLMGSGVQAVLSGSGKIEASHVSCTDLTVTLSGSGKIMLYDTGCTNSNVTISGSGEVQATGECTKSNIIISGSGNIHAENFPAVTSTVNISGSGNAHTRVTEKLSGLISGSGNIYVKGNPVIDVSVSGSGRVISN